MQFNAGVIFRTVTTALISLLTVASVSMSAQAQSFESILEGAKKEGKLTIWLPAPAKDSTHRIVMEEFSKRFGLKTQWEWVPMHSRRTTSRLIVEAGAGRTSVDVLAAEPQEIIELAHKGLLKPYPWVETFGKQLAGLPEPVERLFPEIRGTALAYYDNIYGFGWNTQFIGADKIPSTIAEIAENPKPWVGKLLLNNSGAPLGILSLPMGREKAMDIGRKLLVARPVLKDGTPAVSRALTGGEAPLAVTSSIQAATASKLGEPQGFKLFTDYMPVTQINLMVPDSAPHPNTARLFAAWLVTEGAGTIERLESLGRATNPNSEVGKMVAKQLGATHAPLVVGQNLEDFESIVNFHKELQILYTSAQ